MANGTRLCEELDCGRKHLAKGKCAYHYRIANPPKKNHAMKCPTCGRVTMKRDADRRFCSLECRDAWRSCQPDDPMWTRKKCDLPSDHPVSVLIRENRLRSQKSPLRLAYEDGDWAAVLTALRRRVVEVDDCWLWAGRIKGGYGYVNVGGRTHLVHRLAAASTLGAPVPSHMPVHHACAEPMCFNPMHLQVVTPQENTAEMLERNYYVTRIAALETALRTVAPSHPVLVSAISPAA